MQQNLFWGFAVTTACAKQLNKVRKNYNNFLEAASDARKKGYPSLILPIISTLRMYVIAHRFFKNRFIRIALPFVGTIVSSDILKRILVGQFKKVESASKKYRGCTISIPPAPTLDKKDDWEAAWHNPRLVNCCDVGKDFKLETLKSDMEKIKRLSSKSSLFVGLGIGIGGGAFVTMVAAISSLFTRYSHLSSVLLATSVSAICLAIMLDFEGASNKQKVRVGKNKEKGFKIDVTQLKWRLELTLQLLMKKKFNQKNLMPVLIQAEDLISPGKDFLTELSKFVKGKDIQGKFKKWLSKEKS